MNFKKIIFLYLFTAVVILSFPYFVNAENLIPKITSIVPAKIQNGGEIEIIGENFGEMQGYIRSITVGPAGNDSQQIVDWSDTKIRIKTKALGTTYYCISYGPTDYTPSKICFEEVTIDVCSTFDCVEVAPPKIISVSSQIVRREETIELLGENLNNISNHTQIQYASGNVGEPQVISWSDSKIIVKIKGGYIGQNTLNGSYVDEMGRSINVRSPVFTIKEACQTGDDWSCSDYSACFESGEQTRTCEKTSECQFLNSPMPTLTQTCIYTPACTANDYSCNDWSTCSQSGTQNRVCSKTINCQGGASPPAISQSCTYIPACISFSYSSWSKCTSDWKQTRDIISRYPSNCEGGESPKTTQSCTYVSTCTADTWTCDSWGSCSPSGLQSRSCSKTFDCSSAETAPPATDQYCEPPNRPAQQTPPSGSDEILDQDTIIKSTVKLLCPVDATRASQGSGTIIDSSGTILTNKHVITGTLGCLVGFIDSFNDEPYFGDKQIADIQKISLDEDIAILKIRNLRNIRLTSVNITTGNSNLRLGDKITTYGYPAKFGIKMTYTSGDFSGTDENYLKTTAILEYGNSGGGAYLKNGTFIGIPSAVQKGELNALGYILSVSVINSWLGNSTTAFSGWGNNSYSRVSALEDIDINKLGALKLFVPDTDTKGNLANPSITTSQKSQNAKEQPQEAQAQKESNVIEVTSSNSVVNSNPAPQENEQKVKISWFSNILGKVGGFFKKIFDWF